MNRDGKIGLDSLLTIDDKGFAYDMDLRSGSTFSSENSNTMILRVVGDIPNRTEVQHYFRADSAFAREGKVNYDLKHFPCQSLKANHVYGLFALVAHNFLRALAIVMKPDKPHFAKKLRKRLIHIPGRLVSGSGYLRMKIPTKFFKEVIETLKRWSETFNPIPHLSTA